MNNEGGAVRILDVQNKIKDKKFGFLLFGLCLLACSGCASIRENAKCIAGISTRELEEGRKHAVTKAFNYGYAVSYKRAKDILRKIGAYIYAADSKKHMIAFYVSEEDTTPVGLFFKEIDAQNTQIEVSSSSTYAKERIASRVFALMAGMPDPGEGPGLGKEK